MKLSNIMLLPLVLVMAGCQSVNTGSSENSISTRGTAELMVTPDQAEISFGVEHRSGDLEEARRLAEESVRKLLALTEELSIPPEQVDSTQFVTRPEYRYDDGERKFVGYYVAREIRITLKDLELLGPLTDGAFKAGINSLAPPQLGVSNSREYYRKALRLAAEDARANALTLADSLDARLGRVLSIFEGGVSNEPLYARQPAQLSEVVSGGAAMQAGQVRFTATVDAKFTLHD